MAEYQGSAKLDEQLSLALPSQESVSSVMSQLNAIAQLEELPSNQSELIISSKAVNGATLFRKRNRDIALEFEIIRLLPGIQIIFGRYGKNVRIMDVKTLKIEGRKTESRYFYVYDGCRYLLSSF